MLEYINDPNDIKQIKPGIKQANPDVKQIKLSIIIRLKTRED